MFCVIGILSNPPQVLREIIFISVRLPLEVFRPAFLLNFFHVEPELILAIVAGVEVVGV